MAKEPSTSRDKLGRAHPDQVASHAMPEECGSERDWNNLTGSLPVASKYLFFCIGRCILAATRSRLLLPCRLHFDAYGSTRTSQTKPSKPSIRLGLELKL